MRIGICGKMCSGKSTLAKIITGKFSEDEYKIDSFASKIYEIAYDLFQMKEKDRHLLQQIGTKMREINSNIWIEYLTHKHKDDVHIIIDDVRYINEANTLKKNGYFLIKLNISNELQETRIKLLYENSDQHLNKRNHDSETSLDMLNDDIFDLIINVDDDNIEEIVSNKLLEIALPK